MKKFETTIHYKNISNLLQKYFIVDKFLLIVHYLFGWNNKKPLYLQKNIKGITGLYNFK